MELAVNQHDFLQRDGNGNGRKHRWSETTRLPPRAFSRNAVELCDCMIDITAALLNLSGRELREPGRANRSVTRTRQIAMYVSHCTLGLSMADVGRGFGRDRTTVMHACHIIEDLRDDSEFDRVILTVEKITVAAFRLQQI